MTPYVLLLLLLLLLLLTCTSFTNAQSIDILDLTNNNGYLPIKTDEEKVIEHYNKIIHIINITAYTDTLTLIHRNILSLSSSTTENKALLDTVNKNFALVKEKVVSLNPHFRQKRGLINILGKGLKLVAGSMDSEDELEIKNSLNTLYENEETLTKTLANFTSINNLISSQIQNITNHINQKQTQIENYVNKFKNFLQNKIATIEDEITFLENIYQINNDISLLRDHIDDIGQIIFSCKLGIIPSDILTKTELDLIHDFDSYTNIKVAVALQDNDIILILQIPQYSEKTLSKIVFEPMPNINNKSIKLSVYEVLMDSNNNIFDTYVKGNLKRNLVKLTDKCLLNIINFEEAYCDMQDCKETKIIEIIPGILTFKNFDSKITHNCNKMEIKPKGNFMIKFENCEIQALNRTFFNTKIKIFDKFILPSSLTKIKGKRNETIDNLKLESLYIEQVKHAESIQQVIKQNVYSNLFNISINTIIIIAIILLTIFFVHSIRQKMTILHISSEPQTNGGGVIVKPLKII